MARTTLGWEASWQKASAVPDFPWATPTMHGMGSCYYPCLVPSVQPCATWAVVLSRAQMVILGSIMENFKYHNVKK